MEQQEHNQASDQVTEPVAAAPQEARQAIYESSGDDPRVHLTHQLLVEVPDGKVDPMITLPIDTISRVYDATNRLPGDTGEFSVSREWLQYIQEGLAWETLYGANTALSDWPKREAEWRQVVESQVGPLAMGRNKPRVVDGGQQLSGAAALSRIRTALGLGDRVMVPLWHSGYWVSFNRPDDGAIIDFETAIANETVQLGRATNGAAFSNTSVIHNRLLLEFARDHLHETSLQDRDKALTMASVNDLQAIALGLAAAVYPNGFDFARPVMGETVDDLRIIRGRVRPDKMWFVDRTALTDAHLHQMTRRNSSSISVKEAETYMNTLLQSADKRVVLCEERGISVVFRQACIEDHLTSGDQWVSTIQLMAERAFGMGSDDKRRAAYVRDQAKATFLLQYSHWVKEIHIGEDVVTGREEINSGLREMCSADYLHEAFTAAVNEYIRETLIAIAGVPAVSKEEEFRIPRHPHLVPIDPMSTFFLLVVRKADRIRARGLLN